MPETNAPRLPRARIVRNPVWLDAIEVYKASFDATSDDTLAEGAEAFAEMSPDDQAFHHAHLVFRQVQALGDVVATLRSIETRLGALDPKSLAGLKQLPPMRRALVSIARGQNRLVRTVEQGGLADAIRGEADDDDDGDEDVDAEDAEIIEDEDHGNGDTEALIPEVLPAGARRPTPEAA